jgi:hypothetical protein
MPRGGRKMKGGAEGNPVTINGQSYTISSEDKEDKTVICVSVDKPKAEDQSGEVNNQSVELSKKAAELEGEGELEGENQPAEGGKRRRRRNTAKKGGKSAKKGGKLGGTRKRRGRKGGKK